MLVFVFKPTLLVYIVNCSNKQSILAYIKQYKIVSLDNSGSPKHRIPDTQVESSHVSF